MSELTDPPFDTRVPHTPETAMSDAERLAEIRKFGSTSTLREQTESDRRFLLRLLDEAIAAEKPAYRRGREDSQTEGYCPWHNGYHRNFICEHGYGAATVNQIEAAERRGRAAMREEAAQKANEVRQRVCENDIAVKKRNLSLNQLREIDWHQSGQRHAASEIENTIRALPDDTPAKEKPE